MDPLSNMTSSIKNALAVNKEICVIPYSRVKLAILKILKEEKFIDNVKEVVSKDNKKLLEISLRYINKQPAITEIKRISRQGKRIYQGYQNLRIPKFGIKIVSTPQGLMTARNAKKKKLGGEVICELR